MTSKRLYFVLIGLIVIIVLAIGGGTYETNLMLEKQSGKLVDLKARQASLGQEQSDLIQMKKAIITYNSLYKISQLIVPQSKDQTETVRQLDNLAKQNNVTLSSITFPASSLGNGASSLAINSAVGSSAKATVPAGSGLSTNPALSQLTPIAHIPGVYDLQIQVASSTDPNFLATYPELINYLSSLEQNRLTAQVSSIDIQPASGDRSRLSFTLNLNIFIKP